MASFPSLASHHMQTGTVLGDADAGGPAAKRPRVEDALQHHAPRDQMLITELMGWSQEPKSAMGVVPTGSTDFRALFARQPSQQQPQQQQQYTAHPRAPSVATTGLRTFADVATRPLAAQEDMGRQQVLGALRAAYNSATTSTASGLGCTASQLAWGTDAAEASGAAGAAAAGAAAGPSGSCLEDLLPEQLPVDWAIKRSLTFTSSIRFAIHDKAQQAPPQKRWRALQSIVNGDLDTNGDEAMQYLSCQLSWRHPEVQLEAAALAAARPAAAMAAPPRAAAAAGPSAAAATAGGGSAGNLLSQRLASWRSALHSLYGTYRGGDCNMFYVINSAARSPFVALFTYKGVRGCGELCALVSQSSRALRGRMLAAGVPFTMPLDRAAQPAAAVAGSGDGGGGGGGGAGKAGCEAVPGGADDEADAGLCDEGPQAGPSNGAPLPGSTVTDNSRESLLLLRGPRAVHGLYDFLINEVSYPGMGGRGGAGGGGGIGGTGPGDELSDLPLLLAPVPFDGGAAWRPTVKTLTINSKLAGGGVDATGDLAASLLPGGSGFGFGGPDPGDQEAGYGTHVVHVLQLSGPVPPWTTRRLCALLARLQPSGYNAAMETEPASIPLNSRVIEAARLAGPDADGVGATAPAPQATFAQGGALTLEELTAWQQPSELPGGRPVKGVSCSGAKRLSVRV